MVSRPIEDLLPERPTSQLRIYAYSIQDEAHGGQLKVGHTTQDVKKRVGQQLNTAAIKNFTIEVDEPAVRIDGSVFRDSEVRDRLSGKGFKKTQLEWMECTAEDVIAAIAELRTGRDLGLGRHETFLARPEQAAAVAKTADYFESVWAEDSQAVPRFLWNAKMRFGKTFAAYQLAKRLRAMKVLVVTFKPAVEDAWQSDLTSHIDFEGWQYLSSNSNGDLPTLKKDCPTVYFGSFQDLLGRDKETGTIKSKNEWLHTTNWDLVIFDEYHFGAWRESAKELFEGEDASVSKRELEYEHSQELEVFDEVLDELSGEEKDFLPITTRAYLYLSGTPFKALAQGEFIEEQIFNWTYSDEQRAKHAFAKKHPDEWNPYAALPEMRLLTYQMPDELIAIANQGEFDEFDLNAFFEATGSGANAEFEHVDEVQKWLDMIRGAHLSTQIGALKTGSRPPFPYSDVRLLPYLQHSFWFLPTVASCHAMANLFVGKYNVFGHDYEALVVAGPGAGIGLKALPPVRNMIGSGHDTKTIVLSCGKLTTGVTIPQWSSILMLRNLRSPETYFQAAFRVQSPWSIKNPNGDDPHEEAVIKPVCFVFDFAPTRALHQIVEYGAGLSPDTPNPEDAVEELVKFLPVLAYDGSNMVEIDAGGILDVAMAGTSATLLARKWESAFLVNVDNDTLRKILGNEQAIEAVMKIEGFRALGSEIFETVVNKSEAVRRTKKEEGEKLTSKQTKELTQEEKEYKSKRKQIQQKLIKFATRIPAFMYLTDFRENTLQDVITKLEPELFKSVSGLEVEDFNLLVSLGVFNASHMNQAVFAFRRYEDASLQYSGIDSHPNLRHIGLYDTVIAAVEIDSQ